MKKSLLIIALLTATAATAQNTPRAPTKEAPEILASAVTAMVFGPIATAYGESRYKEVCEKVLLGKWVSGAPDECPTGDWLNVWRFKQ